MNCVLYKCERGAEGGVICSQYKGQQNEWQTTESEDGVEKKGKEEDWLNSSKEKKGFGIIILDN